MDINPPYDVPVKSSDGRPFSASSQMDMRLSDPL